MSSLWLYRFFIIELSFLLVESFFGVIYISLIVGFLRDKFWYIEFRCLVEVFFVLFSKWIVGSCEKIIIVRYMRDLLFCG